MYINVTRDGKNWKIKAKAGENIANILIAEKIEDSLECGRGVCGKCAVKLLHGSVMDNLHKICHAPCKILACQSQTRDEDIHIELPIKNDDNERKTLLPFFTDPQNHITPLVEKIFLKLPMPSPKDSIADLERVKRGLNRNIDFCPGLLATLPDTLRKNDFNITCVLANNKLIAVEAGNTCQKNYGIAVDIGTTTAAVYLADINLQKVIASYGFGNPQRIFGADVISRITACQKKENITKLQCLITEGVSNAIARLLEKQNILKENVYAMVIVGNTAMRQMFLGINSQYLAESPFIPAASERIEIYGNMSLMPVHQFANIQLPACISSFIGSDLLACAIDAGHTSGYSLIVDIGTNGEILLIAPNAMYACSAAAGPAFEGAHIENGMRAGTGAIEKITLKNNKVCLEIIGSCAPGGICGSGLIDGTAELLKTGLLDKSGRFTTDNNTLIYNPLAKRLRENRQGMREFVLAFKNEAKNSEDIVITQKDIREIQQAKAAVEAGINILLKEAGISENQLDKIFLAGAFGSYLNCENAILLGMLPNISKDKIVYAGNAAAKGAVKCLFSQAELQKSDSVARSIKALELSERPDFNELWLSCLNFPEIC